MPSNSLSARSSGPHDLPLVAAACEPVVVVLHPHDGHVCLAGLVDELGDVRHDRVTRVGAGDYAVLHVDDEEGSVWPVLERGHRVPSIVSIFGSLQCCRTGPRAHPRGGRCSRSTSGPSTGWSRGGLGTWPRTTRCRRAST